MKKKVLHVIPTLGGGGAERLLADVVSKTSRSELSHTVCVLDDEGLFGQVIRNGGHDLICLNLPGRSRWLKAAGAISKLMDETNPDLVVTWLLDGAVPARLAMAWTNRVPMLATLHSTDYDKETIVAGNWPPWKVEVLRWVDKLTAAIAKTQFVACSETVADSYSRYLGIQRSAMKVIHNFVDPERFRPTAKAANLVRGELDIPKNGFVYINVGRLDPQKGQMKLIRAFARVAGRVPNAYLVIAGGGIMEESLKDLTQTLHLQDRVRLAGPRVDVANCLASSDVFVFPSLIEGFGIALIEAMSQGLPCIASDLQVFKEIIEDGVSGFLVEGGNEELLARQMERVFIDAALRESVGDRARERVINSFSYEAVIPKWNRVLLDTAK